MAPSPSIEAFVRGEPGNRGLTPHQHPNVVHLSYFYLCGSKPAPTLELRCS